MQASGLQRASRIACTPDEALGSRLTGGKVDEIVSDCHFGCRTGGSVVDLEMEVPD